jgi:ABC-type uncharacterized transport system substrate-binding protein
MPANSGVGWHEESEREADRWARTAFSRGDSMNGTARGLLPALAMVLMSPWAAESISAQQSTGPPHIGVVAPNVGSAQSESAQAFRDGLRDAGYAEGRNLFIDWWYGNGSYDRLGNAIAGFVERKVDVIVVESTVAALGLRAR